MRIFDQADESEAGLPPFLRFLDRVECHGHTAERIGHRNAGGMEQAVGHRSVARVAAILFAVEHHAPFAGRRLQLAQNGLVFFPRSAVREVAARSGDFSPAFIGYVEVAFHRKIAATIAARVRVISTMTAARELVKSNLMTDRDLLEKSHTDLRAEITRLRAEAILHADLKGIPRRPMGELVKEFDAIDRRRLIGDYS